MNKRYLIGIWIGFSAAVFAVSGLIRIPIQPMAFTMQVFAVFLIPLVFGSTVAFFGFLLYVCLGLIGLPVFSSGGGIGYILSPTLGYLIGFLITTITTGMICKRINGLTGLILAGIVFILIIYSIGIAWFYFNMIYIQGKNIGFLTVAAMNAIPYIAVDAVKIAAAIAIVPIVKKMVNN